MADRLCRARVFDLECRRPALLPVGLSASHIAYCALGTEPVSMVLGHAAGVAAKLAIDVSARQSKLREQKAVLELKR